MEPKRRDVPEGTSVGELSVRGEAGGRPPVERPEVRMLA